MVGQGVHKASAQTEKSYPAAEVLQRLRRQQPRYRPRQAPCTGKRPPAAPDFERWDRASAARATPEDSQRQSPNQLPIFVGIRVGKSLGSHLRLQISQLSRATPDTKHSRPLENVDEASRRPDLPDAAAAHRWMAQMRLWHARLIRDGELEPLKKPAELSLGSRVAVTSIGDSDTGR